MPKESGEENFQLDREEEEEQLDRTMQYDVEEQRKLVPLFNDRLWPKEKDVGLDESQLEALKLALRNELALIQGPPGTGKTFIGYKLVQILLDNRNLWLEKYSGESRPILVVCYTNHALDQFLEGAHRAT